MDVLVTNISRCPQQSVPVEDFTELLWNNLTSSGNSIWSKQLEGKLGAKQLVETVEDLDGYWASTLRE